MKKVFQIKLKNITKVLALVIAVSLVTFTGCKDYDEDIANLETEIAKLKTDLTALNTSTVAASDAKIAALTAEVNTLKTKVATLESTGATDAEVTAAIAAAKTDIMSRTATIEAFNAYKTTNDAAVAALTTKVNAAATQAALDAAKADLNTQINAVKASLTSLGADVTGINTKVTGLTADVAKLTADLGKVKGDVEARLAIIEGLLKISAGKSTVLDGFTASLADQLAKINANTSAITALQTSLNAEKAKIVTLQADVAKHTTDIAALQTAVTALQASVVKINANLKTIASAMSLNFDVLSSRLSSLTYVPEFYVNGIEAMNFSPLTSRCKAITPDVTVAYHLNPSFITAADIETNNLGFVVVQSQNMITGYMTAKAAETRVKANFVKIEGGKIYVNVSVVDFNTLLGATGGNILGGSMEKFHSIALQVPLSEKAVKENALEFDANGTVVTIGDKTFPADRVITAQYVRLFHKTIAAQTDVYLAKNVTNYPKFPQTVAGAKALTIMDIDGATVTDPTVITLPYGTTKDLVNDVIAIYQGAGFDVVKYGLKFKFDLLELNENGTTSTIVYNRGSNNTDQQQFIKINDAAKGTIEAKVFSQAEIAAAQGRTPIVRVWMYNDLDPNCPVLNSYIKIYLAEKPLPTPVVVPFTFADAVGPCTDVTGVLTVQQVNEQLYNKVGLSKEEFHAAYPTALFTYSGDGVVNERYQPDNQTTDTYLMNWTLTALQIWTKLITASPATFTATAIYTPTMPSVYPKITITFTRKFTKPADLNIAAAQLISNYWYPNATSVPNVTNAISTTASTAMPYNYVKHNIVVPQVGETNSALAIFSNNINQAFEQNANKSLKALANYEYYFIPNTLTPGATSDKFGMNDQSQPIMMVNGVKYQLTASADGKTLLNGSDVVASINSFAANVGDVLTLNQASATAKLLLNAGPEFLKVRIAIRTVYCANLPQFKMPVTINGKPYMDVVFVRPINPQPAADQYFVDALNFGDKYTYLEIAKLTNLNDWRFADPVASFATHFNYWSYYGITNITADASSIRTDLNQAAGVTVPVSQYPDLRVLYYPNLVAQGVALPAATTPNTFFGYLTYQNTGNTLGKLFNLYVPVTITYSWGTIQSATVTVPVWKTVGSAGVKAKK